MNHKRAGGGNSGGGKGKGKHLEDINNSHNRHKNQASNNLPQPDEPQYEGSLKRNSLVLALSRNSTTEYQLAKIIEIRPQKTGNEEDAQLDKMLLGDKLTTTTV